MVALLLTTCLLAQAHVGAPIDAIDVHPVGDTGRALEASVGLVWTEAGDDWRWVCHEAITTPDAVITPRYAVAGRRWLATVPRLEQSRTEADAVYWTDDGCTWTPAEGLAGHEVPAIALDAAGSVALAVTGDPDAPTNAILRSTDGGRTFYTSLGHIDDFKQPAFRRLLTNAVYWAAGLEVPAQIPTVKVSQK